MCNSRMNRICVLIKLCHVFFCIQRAGPGHRLDSTDAGTSKPSKKDPDAYVPPDRSDLTAEAR